MALITDLLKELAQLRDELHLQSHLMTMDLADEWREAALQLTQLEAQLEHSLLDIAEKIGRAEEHYFVDNDDNIHQLVARLRKIKHSVNTK